MTVYHTMTVAGGRGSTFVADTDVEATILAQRAGYEVLDITDDVSGDAILVIAE